MPTTLEPPPTPHRPAAEPPRPRLDRAEFDRTLHLAEQGLHLAGLLARIAVYAGLLLLAHRTDFGPHLFAGVLLGDAVAFLLFVPLRGRRTPLPVAVELLAYAALSALSLPGYALPDATDYRAILVLAAFAGFVGRVGANLMQRGAED